MMIEIKTFMVNLTRKAGKLLLDSSLFNWLSLPATTGKSYVSMYLVSNMINIILMIFVSLIFALLRHTENSFIRKYGPSGRL